MARALQLIDDIDLPGNIPIAQRNMTLRFYQVLTNEPQVHGKSMRQQRRLAYQIQSSPRSCGRLGELDPFCDQSPPGWRTSAEARCSSSVVLPGWLEDEKRKWLVGGSSRSRDSNPRRLGASIC